jgi:hypothetical protein
VNATETDASAPRVALAQALDLGATAQATVPGFYAWAVTVAPAAFAKGSAGVAMVAAALGLLLVLVAPLFERRWVSLGRVMSIWGLILTSLFVWVLAPAHTEALGRSDMVRGIAGMFGWALFALAHVAPALPRRERAADELSRRLSPRGDSGRVDAIILGAAIVVAVLLQCIGWHAEEAERSVLVRLVSLAAGVIIVSASASVVVSRHAPQKALSGRRRAKRAILPLVLFGLWVLTGTAYALVLRR